MAPSLPELLALMLQRRASDLHLTVGAPPMLRVDGRLLSAPFAPLTPELTQALAFSVMTEAQRGKFEARNELDMAFGSREFGRMRMNVFRQRGAVGAAIRAIPSAIPTFEQLNLPPVVGELMRLEKGLILVTGPTGSGKSTTLASMIDYLNGREPLHIVTVEDPIEYVHTHKKSLVNQREVGSDTESFHQALRHMLRQDPDVILIGEMRDLETISTALTIAETGHLVLGTLHTTDVAQTLHRIIDVFPPHQQEQIRVQLSFVLQAVLSQALVPLAQGSGRTLACEVMLATSAIRNLIRERKEEQMSMVLQSGGRFGMQTMNQALAELCRRQRIQYAEALLRSGDPEDFKRLIGQAAPEPASR